MEAAAVNFEFSPNYVDCDVSEYHILAYFFLENNLIFMTEHRLGPYGYIIVHYLIPLTVHYGARRK